MLIDAQLNFTKYVQAQIIEFVKLAPSCASNSAKYGPTMVEVVSMLRDIKDMRQ
jgi:hypothetical protein